MRTTLATCLFILVLGTSEFLAAADFGLLDQHGRFHQLSRYRAADAVAILTFSYEDETSLQSAAKFASSCHDVTDTTLVCLLLNASDDPVDIRANDNSPGDLPVLIDSSQTVARTLDVETLGSITVLDPKSQKVSDVELPALSEVLSEVLSEGAPLQYRYIEALGDRTISYQEEIAPLLQRRCAYCHVENGLAPWAMNRHIMVMGWSPMMRETLITRRMPPGQIDSSVGNWANTPELTDAEMALLVEWIDRGAPREGDGDPLTEAPDVAGEWPLGEPDLIVDVPEQQLPATGNIDFLVKRASLDLPADRWLSAVSYQVGDRSVLHSLLIYALDKNVQSTDPDTLIDGSNADYISVYVPGETDDVFADDTAFLLRSNHDLVFKLRYLTSGRETVDRTRIGLYFRDSQPDRQLRTIALEKPDFDIPANVSEHTESLQTAPLSNDVWLESYSPHAHSRGKSMAVSVTYPDGKQEQLINVANFNYNWQLSYKPVARKLIPAGSVLKAETVYDNSDANPFNPEPDRELSAGYSGDSEMFSHFIRVAEPLTDAIRTQ